MLDWKQQWNCCCIPRPASRNEAEELPEAVANVTLSQNSLKHLMDKKCVKSFTTASAHV